MTGTYEKKKHLSSIRKRVPRRRLPAFTRSAMGAAAFGCWLTAWVPGNASAEVSALNSPTSVDRNTSTAFSLAVENSDGAPAGTVCEFVLTVDAAFSAVSVPSDPPSWTSSVSGNEITWTTIAACLLPENPSTFVTFSWQATSPAAGGDYTHDWDSAASGSIPVGSGGYDTHVNEADFSTSAKVSTDSNGGDVEPGDILAYEITIANSGDMDATSVTVRDTLPSHVVAVTNTGSAILEQSYPPNFILRWDAGTISQGGQQAHGFDAELASSMVDGTAVSNRAHASSPDASDAALTNTTTNIVVSAEDFSTSTKTFVDLNGAPVQGGDVLRYTMTATNSGNMDATSSVVTDSLPTEFASYVIGSTTMNGGGIADVGSDSPLYAGVTVNNSGAGSGVVEAGQSVVLTADVLMDLDAPPASETKNIFTITTDSLMAKAKAPFAVVESADFSGSTKTSVDANGGDLRPGNTLGYTLTIRNDGNLTSTTTTVRDTLASEIVLVSNSGAAVIEQSYPPFYVLRWDLGSIAPAAEQVLTFDADLDSPLDDGIVIQNHGWISTPDSPLNFSTSTVADTVLAEVDFSTGTKAVVDVNGGLAQGGDVLRYTLTIPNTGDMNATSCFVTDNLPTNGVSYVAGSTTLNGVVQADSGGPSSPLEAGLTVNSPSGTAGQIVAGESAVITVEIVIDEDVPSGVEIDNSFTVTSDQENDGAVAATVTTLADEHTVVVSPDVDVSTCDVVPYSIVFEAVTTGAFDLFFETLVDPDLEFVAGSGSVTNSGGGTTAVVPDIAGTTWKFNHDGTDPNPGDLAVWDVSPGETLTLTFDLLVIGCDPAAKVLQTSTNYKRGTNTAYSLVLPLSFTDLDLLEGALNLQATPTAPSAAIGDTLIYTTTVSSVGFGDAGNIFLSSHLEPGLLYLPAETTPAPDSVASSASGTELFWFPSTFPLLQDLAPGNSVDFVVGTQLLECVEYDQTLRARWGCGPAACQTLQTTTSVTLDITPPIVSMSIDPDPLVIPRCDAGGLSATLTIRNDGGLARELLLEHSALPGSVELTNVAGASYLGGVFDVGDLDEADSLVITFDLIHDNSCDVPSGSLYFTPTYFDACRNDYTTPVLLTSYSTAGSADVEVTKTGEDEVVVGATETYTISVCYADVPGADIRVVDHFPTSIMSFNGVTNRVPTEGATAGSDSTVWVIPAGEFPGCVDITYELVADADSCGVEQANNAEASTTLSCGTETCTSSDSDGVNIILTCSDACSLELDHTVNGAEDGSSEVCVPMTHRSVFTMGGVNADPMLFSYLTFRADKRLEKDLLGFLQPDSTYSPGVARFFVHNTATGDSCWMDLEPTGQEADGTLYWDLIALDSIWTEPTCQMPLFTDFADLSLEIVYDLVSDVPLGEHFEYTEVEVVGSPACDGRVFEPVEMSFGEAETTISVGIPILVNECEVSAVPISLSTEGGYGTFDNVLYLSTEDFEYIDDPTDPDYFPPIFSGIPDVGVPTRIGDVGNGAAGVYWKLGDFPEGTSGTITVPMRKLCNDESTYARVVFDNRCDDDDADNVGENAGENSTIEDPALILRPLLQVELTPETFFTANDTVQWTTYIINGGTAAAKNVRMTHTTTATSLEFVEVELFDGDGNPQPDDLLDVEYGGGRFSLDYSVAELPSGETWYAIVHGVLNDCDDLDHFVEGSWGCYAELCQETFADTASAVTTPVRVIATVDNEPTFPACDTDSVQVTILNASAAQAHNVAFTLDIPTGLVYVNGSTRISISHVSGTTLPTVTVPSGAGANPVITAQRLSWNLKDVLSGDYLSPSDRVTIAVDLAAEPGFVGGPLAAGGSFDDNCGGSVFITSDNGTASGEFFDPALVYHTATLDELQVCTIPGTDANQLLLSIENPAGNGTLHGPGFVVQELPEGVLYRTFTTELTYPTDSGTVVRTSDPTITGSGVAGDPEVLTWALPANAQLGGGETILVQVEVTHNEAAGCSGLDLTNRLSLQLNRCATEHSNGEEITIGPFQDELVLLTPEVTLDIEVRNLSGTSSPTPGDLIQILAIRENIGNGTARETELTLTMDISAVTFLSATPDRDSDSGDDSIWNTNLAELTAGERDTVLVDARIGQSVALGDIILVDASLEEECCGGVASDTEILVIGGIAHLDIEKVASQSVIVPGELVTYEVLVRNDGQQRVQNVVVAETPVLPGLTFLSSEFDVDNVIFTGTTSVPEWTIASTSDAMEPFDPGALEAIRLTYRAGLDAMDIGTPAGSGDLANEVSITGVESLLGDALTGDNVLDSDTESLPVATEGAAISVHKYAPAGAVVVGELVTYIVRTSNTGEQLLIDVDVVDVAPSGLTFVSAQFDESLVTETSTSPPTYRIGQLETHSTQEIALTFQASDDQSDLTDPVQNIARASGLDQSSLTVFADPDTSLVPLQIGSESAIQMLKTPLSPVLVAGSEAEYLLTVMNTGETDLTTIVVTDILPASLTYLDAVPAAVESPAQTLTWNLADLAVSESHQIVLRVQVDDAATGTVSNTAGVSGVDPTSAAVNDADTADSEVVVGNSSIHVQKIPTTPSITLGGQVVYILSVHNDGDQLLSDVVLTDPLPDGTTFAYSDFDPARWDLASSGATVQWDLLGDLQPGQREDLTLILSGSGNIADYDLGSDSLLVNTATAIADDPQGSPVTDDGTGSVDIQTPAGAVLMSKTATTGEVVPGGEVTYNLIVENIGSQDLTALRVREPDLVGQGLTFVSSEYDTGVFTYSFTGTEHIWTAIGTFPPGQKETIQVTFLAAADVADIANPVVNTARVDATDENGSVVSGSDSEGLPISFVEPGVQIQKSATQGVVTPGETVDYLLTVTNSGGTNIVSAVVSEISLESQGLTYLSSNFDTDFWSETADLTWVSNDTLKVGYSEIIRVSFLAGDIESLPATVSNTASVDAEDIWGRELVDEMTESLPVSVPYASIDIEATALAAAAVPGEALAYLVTVTNNGDADLFDVSIVDILPLGVTYSWADFDSANVSFVGDTTILEWTIEDPFAPGAIEQIRIVTQVNEDPDALQDPVRNLLRVEAEDGAGDSVSDEDEDTLPLQLPFSLLEVNKIAAQNVVVPGSPVLYHIFVENRGNTLLEELVVTEYPPAGFLYTDSDFSESGVAFSGTTTSPAWTISELPVGRTEIISVWFQSAPNPNDIDSPAVNRVEVTAGVPGGASVDAEDEAELPVQGLDSAIRLDMLALDSVVVPGEAISYRLRVHNVGADSLYSVILVNPVPTGLAFLSTSFDNGRATHEETGSSWTLTDPLAPGDDFEARVTFLANAADTLIANPVVNVAEVTSVNISEEEVTDQGIETVPLEQPNAVIDIRKSTTQPVVSSGGTIIYNVTVTNIGNRDLFDARIEELVPPGLTYASSNFDAQHVTFDGTTEEPSWRIASLIRGSAESLTLRFEVDPVTANLVDPVVNEVTVAASDASGSEVSDRADEVTPVQKSEPSIHVEKVATRGTAKAGEDLTYLITVFNDGLKDLDNVEVIDFPPPLLVYQSSHFDHAHVAQVFGTDEIRWTIPSLPAAGMEQIRISFTVPTNVALPDTLVNSVTVAGVDVNGLEVSDSSHEVVALELGEPALQVETNAVQGEVVAGGTVTYLLNVRNVGDTDLYDVVVSDVPDSVLTWKYSQFDNNVVEQSAEDPLTWRIEELRRGHSETIRVTFDAEGLGFFRNEEGSADGEGLGGDDDIVTNRVTATGTTLEGAEVDDADVEYLPVVIEPAAVQILKTTDFTGDAAFVGTEVGYHLQVINMGHQRLHDLTVTDLMPAGLVYTYADIDPDEVIEQENAGSAVVWMIPALAAQEQWTVLVVGRIEESLEEFDRIENCGVVTGYGERGDMVQDKDIAPIRVLLPEIEISKTVDRDRTRPGGALVYRVFYRNPGAIAATDVLVADPLSEDLEFVSGSATGIAEYDSRSHSIFAGVGTLEPGAAGSFSYQVQVSDALGVGDCVPNLATIFSENLSPVHSDTVTTCILTPSLSLQKSVSRETASPGDTLSYTLTYENAGTVAQNDVTVRDAIPAQTHYVDGSAGSNALYDVGAQEIIWPIGKVPVGAMGTVSYSVVVDSGAQSGDFVRNTASLAARDMSELRSNEVGTQVITLNKLAVTKWVDLLEAQPGDTLLYAIEVNNTWDRPVTGVTLNDVIPVDVLFLEGAGDVLPTEEAAGRLQWELGTLLPGATSRVTFQVLVGPASSGTWIENGAVASSNEIQNCPSNLVRTLVLFTELAIEKEANRLEASIGDQIEYTVTIDNTGSIVAEDVQIRDTFPEAFTYVLGTSRLYKNGQLISSEDPTGVEGSSDPGSRNVYVWTVGDLEPSDEVSIRYEALIGSAASEGRHRNVAVVIFDQGDQEDASAEAESDVEVQTPHLVISKTTPGRQVSEGDIVLYTLEVQNPSGTAASNVSIVDQPPIGMRYVPGSASLNGVSISDPTGSGPYRWSIGSVSSGEDKTLTYAFLVGLNAPAGVAINQAYVEGEDPIGGVLRAGPAEARVNVVPAEEPSSIRGWVFRDCDGDGKPDGGDLGLAGIPGVRVLLEDGRRATTDSKGEYFFYPVPIGDHLVRIDKGYIPEDAFVSGPDAKFVYALSGGQGRASFAVCAEKPVLRSPSEAILRFSKAANPSNVERLSSAPPPERFVLPGLNFDVAKAELKPSAFGVLDLAAKKLKENPASFIRIEGHTDIRPIRTEEFASNYELSVRRATSVEHALITRYGIDPARLETRGFGPDVPISKGTTPADFAKNRRVELLVFSPAEHSEEWYDPNTIHYQVSVLYSGEVALADVEIVDTLPQGLEFEEGSVRINGVPFGDPVQIAVGDSVQLNWDLGTVNTAMQKRIEYDVRIRELDPSRPLVNRARLHWRTPAGILIESLSASAPIKLRGWKNRRPLVITLDSVLFDSGKAGLRGEAQKRLDEVVHTLREADPRSIRVEGHTDNRAIRTREFADNQELSEARARSVMDYLVKEGKFARDVVESLGFGARRPVAPNRRADEMQKNRRVEIYVDGRESAWDEGETGLEFDADVQSEVEVRIGQGGRVLRTVGPG